MHSLSIYSVVLKIFLGQNKTEGEIQETTGGR